MSQYGHLLVALAGAGKDTEQVSFTPRDAALAALLVDCISEYDPTRLGAIKQVRYKGEYALGPDNNRLLTPQFCRSLLNSVLRGQLVQTPKPPKAKQAADDSPKVGKVTAVVVEKTDSTRTTSSYDPSAEASPGAPAKPKK